LLMVTLELILGIIGTVTGVVSSFVHIWNYFQNKPKLSLEVNSCTFEEIKDDYDNPKRTNIYVNLDVMNKGNKTTSIRKIKLQIFLNDKVLTLSPFPEETAHVEPGKTERIRLMFPSPFIIKEKVRCKIIVTDTRSKKMTKTFNPQDYA